MSLELWQKRHELTIEEVVILAAGGEPRNEAFLESNIEKISAIKGKLVEDLKKQIKEARILGVAYREDNFVEEDCVKSGIVFFGCLSDDYLSICNDELLFDIALQSIKLNVEEVKAWFVSIDWKPKFFFPDDFNGEDTTSAAEPATEEQSIKHQTRLMNIMLEAINRYYGETFEPENKDSHTSKEVIVDWLKEKHALSKNRAEAIELVINPRGDNYLEGKR